MSAWDIEAPTRTGDAPPAAEPPAPAGRRRLRLRLRMGWIVGGVALLLAGALLGFYLARSQSADEEAELTQLRQKLSTMENALAQAEERIWDHYRSVQALTAENEALRAGGEPQPGAGEGSSPGTSVDPEVLGSYGDGVFLVGEDIFPGAYDGVVMGKVGYWARLKDTDGAVGSIITNAVPRGPFVLTVVESDKAVELRGVRLTAR